MWIGSVDLGMLDHGKENDMSREWKVGDRFNRTITVSTDYEITRIDEKFVYLSDGKNIVIWPLFYLDDVTPLIPATPEPQKLDTTKPVRRIWSGNTGRIVGRTIDGKKLVFEHDLGGMCIGPESDFENIPEPKRTYEQIVELVPFFDGIRIVEPGDPFKFVGIKSRAKISYVEGEGWSIEEVAS